MSCGGSGQLSDELASSSWPLRIDPRVDSGRAERVVSFVKFCTVTETFNAIEAAESHFNVSIHENWTDTEVDGLVEALAKIETAFSADGVESTAAAEATARL